MNIKLDIENKEEVILWLQEIKRGTGDARPLWYAVTPRIIEFVDYQFRESDDAAKRWRSLTPKYKAWKARKGFPTAIGVKTGKLRQGAGALAVKQYHERELVWGVNNNVVVEKGLQYAKYFDKDRPVYRNVVLRVNSFLSFDIKQFMAGAHNSFTYIWLRDALRKTGMF